MGCTHSPIYFHYALYQYTRTQLKKRYKDYIYRFISGHYVDYDTLTQQTDLRYTEFKHIICKDVQVLTNKYLII